MSSAIDRRKECRDYVRALGINDFGHAVSIGRTKVYGLIRSGQIRSVMIGGRRVIPIEEADKLLQSQD